MNPTRISSPPAGFGRPRRPPAKPGPARPRCDRAAATRRKSARNFSVLETCGTRNRLRRNRPQRRVRPTGACGPWRDAPPKPGGRPPSPSSRGTRGDACERACWADKCASRRHSDYDIRSRRRRLYSRGGAGAVNVGGRDEIRRAERSRCSRLERHAAGRAMSGRGNREVMSMLDDAAVRAADRAARIWAAAESGPIAPGQRGAQGGLLPDAARHPQPLQAFDHRLAGARRRRRATASSACRFGTSPCRPRGRPACAC